MRQERLSGGFGYRTVSVVGAVALCAGIAVTSGARATSTSTANCAPVEILSNRGSGDSIYDKHNGLGAPGYAVWRQLEKLIPGVGYPWANPYSAVGVFGWDLRQLANGAGAGTKLSGLGLGAYHDSAVEGTSKLASQITTFAAKCRNVSKLVLIGYSQGAQVAGDVFQRKLTTAEKKMVAAVVLFGDPYFNGGDRKVARSSFSGRRDGILGRRPAFKTGDSLVLSYCHSHDPICQGLFFRVGPTRTPDPGSLTFRQHLNYTGFGEPTEIAVQVAKKLQGHVPRYATTTEETQMKRAITDQACGPRAAVVSRKDPRFGVIIAQFVCGASTYSHWFLRRESTSPTASWSKVDVRSGGIDEDSGCTTVPVPADIRCY